MIESLLPTMEEDGTVNEVKKRFIYIGEDYNDYKNSCYIGLAKTKEKTNQMGEDGQSEDTPVGDEETQKTFEVMTLEKWKEEQDSKLEGQEHPDKNNKIIKNEGSLKNVIFLIQNVFNDIAQTFWERDTCCFFSLNPFYLQDSSFFSMQYKSEGESDGHIVLVPYSAVSSIDGDEQKAEKIMGIVAPYKQESEELEVINEIKTYDLNFNNIYATEFIIQCILCEDIGLPSGYYIPVLKIPLDWAGPKLYRFLSIR